METEAEKFYTELKSLVDAECLFREVNEKTRRRADELTWALLKMYARRGACPSPPEKHFRGGALWPAGRAHSSGYPYWSEHSITIVLDGRTDEARAWLGQTNTGVLLSIGWDVQEEAT